VYEYVYVTDTVWKEAPARDTIIISQLNPIENSTLVIDTTSEKADLVIFSSTGSATIPINCIILDGNQYQSKMKRKGIFTVLLLSLQSLSFAQGNWSLNAGTSSMWLQHHTSTVSKTMWAGGHLGAEVCIPIRSSRFSFSLGETLSFLTPTADYKQTKVIDESLPEYEYEYAKIQTDIILNELNTGLFDSSYVKLSFPLKINFQIGKWRPFLGVEYSFSSFLYKIPENKYIDKSYYPKTYFHDIGIISGTSYSFSKKIGCSVELCQGLIGKFNAYKDRMAPTLGVDEYFFKSLNVNLNFIYNF
jgi:hypothetical protein